MHWERMLHADQIADIAKDPGHYAGKDVSIEGGVSESFSALAMAAR
jgi:hypothetical protein